MATYSSNTTVKWNNDSNQFDTATAGQTKSLTVTPPASGYNITSLFWSGLVAGDVINVYISAAVYYAAPFASIAQDSLLDIHHSGNALKLEVVSSATAATRKIAIISSSFVNTP